MTSPVSLVLPSTLVLRGPMPGTLSIGLLAPLSGVMGVAGPSILNCAQLAAEHVAERTGLATELVAIDAGQSPGEVARAVRQLIDARLIQGLVGAHTSDVRVAVSSVVPHGMPYVFTPPHESGQGKPGTVFTGSAPQLQLRHPLEWIIRHHSVRRWALIGGDYVWPRQVHREARSLLRALGQEIVMDRFVALGSVDAGRLLDEARSSRAEAILVSLVGRDGITFHRGAAEYGADRQFVRLCTALDENCLLAVGGDATGMLYSAMPSFILQQDDEHQSFIELYLKRFGISAPLPASYAEGCHDGVLLLAELWLSGLLESMPPAHAALSLAAASESAGAVVGRSRGGRLARAEGNELVVINEVGM
ncbi:substrate-binding domain-containing protein [Sinomonas susongensis]|uniref:substrate-binding domain-containing protein n=1 Tax=Sinomonas susongensis TaxID=1324851 RepID=UPI001109E95F|nr:substrate-binding domain-containing protein [Sinomonas susongensis]